MAKVLNKREVMTVPNPAAAYQKEDPFADFREVEMLELHWEQTYHHSLGKYSKFFLELEKKRFLATKCPKCGKVWTPPRPVCPKDLQVTEWVELRGEGTLEGYSICEFAPAFVSSEKPYVLAYVALDGADTLFCHQLRHFGDRSNIKVGMRVRVAYADGEVSHPIRLMYFEPM